MDETVPTRYWCHMCSQVVNPVIEAEIKCPYCQDGFVEEMSSTARDAQEADSEFGSDRALSLWAPILLGMMGNPQRRRRIRRLRFDDEDDDENDDMRSRYGGDDTEFDREIASMIRRRRRSSATILQLLQGIRAGMASELENPDADRDRDREGDRDRDRLLLINPFNQTIILQGSGSSYDSTDNSNLVGSLGDYFIGPGLDLLLQHLAENDPNRYGTPPARKEAIEALPTVAVKETSQCSVCLDDLEMGTEAKEMPCKHKFHGKCILPWLELHSSCPVCRFQLPADETKLESSDGNRNGNRESERESGVGLETSNATADSRNGGGGRRFTIPWPFTGLFSSSSSGGGNSTTSSSSANARGSSSPTDDN
ncbi:E3 ubiquitin-protein ligase SIRP1-like [Punica granatum]|uniref:E3 ubiquitin-protein ligase SIRP1-like n=2 Tax=Punica granatum TaxID=22663 RepID=A0A6P8DSL2_PUNGR|nr:E3 ubiquitin-protein ligase SIRP1-like [Punica granatum]XP_031400427.1 E3 ubiquitin-protein ligase SIRP1-like [Punica granatum]XP_031400428.1 E3 ubiquitin-protein ligase SIRP1-like [Punica granatum]OWM69299.1 hypothetical protein CDL15_Pgr025486 [Punica granatum]PKI61356.1 hypothetical protein CRG98_018258 [Punica granatum]